MRSRRRIQSQSKTAANSDRVLTTQATKVPQGFKCNLNEIKQATNHYLIEYNCHDSRMRSSRDSRRHADWLVRTFVQSQDHKQTKPYPDVRNERSVIELQIQVSCFDRQGSVCSCWNPSSLSKQPQPRKVRGQQIADESSGNPLVHRLQCSRC